MNSNFYSDLVGAIEGIASGGPITTILKVCFLLFGSIIGLVLFGRIKSWFNAQAAKQTQQDQQKDQSDVANQTGQIAVGADQAASDIDNVRKGQ